jgi:putative methyltransferase (TIGR04325 family)
MCRVAPWDYPVVFWLERLLYESGCVLDAGGHMGTKYRAFRQYLRLEERKIRWIIYDLPVLVDQGKKRALEEGLNKLEFIDTLSNAPAVDIKLVSGLLQYLDIPFSDLVGQMRSLPQHIIVNKVALREEETIFTLENFGVALVPYQIRNRQVFLNEIHSMGYDIMDEWEIPSLSHVIPSRSEAGRSQSAGFYLKLKDAEA